MKLKALQEMVEDPPRSCLPKNWKKIITFFFFLSSVMKDHFSFNLDFVFHFFHIEMMGKSLAVPLLVQPTLRIYVQQENAFLMGFHWNQKSHLHCLMTLVWSLKLAACYSCPTTDFSNPKQIDPCDSYVTLNGVRL